MVSIVEVNMAVIYFAKVNINSNIYEVYGNPNYLNEILDTLLQNMNSDSLPIKINKNDRIAFFDIEKNMSEYYVVGRLGKIFKDEIKVYNAVNNSVEPFATENVVKSAIFFFDLKNEIIAFMTAQTISRGNFVKYFQILLNSYMEDVQFEIFLKTSSSELEKQIERLDKVLKVDFTVVPPNSNEEEFNDLFPKNGDEIRETRATKLQQTLSSSKRDIGINMESSFLRRIIVAVSKGFGTIKIVGETDGNHRLDASNYDMPQKVTVPDRIKKNAKEFIGYARSEIKKIIFDEDKTKD